MALNRLTEDMRRLVESALAASAAAYAPYSQFRVGAAVRGGSGRVYVGCNVENASSPVTLCAERNALGSAVAAGETRVEAVAVASADKTIDSLTPCGACRQFIAEFGPAIRVVSIQGGQWTVQSIEDLLPVTFARGGGLGTVVRETGGVVPRQEEPKAESDARTGLPTCHPTPNRTASPVAGLELKRVVRAAAGELHELARRDEAIFGRTALRAVDFSVITWAGAVFDGRAGGETVASCQLVRTWDDPEAAWVVGFYVLPEHRRRGFGRELLQEVAAEAACCGLRRLLLTVGPDNIPALSLYESFGFAISEMIPDFYGPGEDRYLLKFALRSVPLGAAGGASAGDSPTAASGAPDPTGTGRGG